MKMFIPVLFWKLYYQVIDFSSLSYPAHLEHTEICQSPLL